MPRDIVFLAIAIFTWGLGESAFIAFQPPYLQALGASPIQIGSILSSYSLAASLTHIPAGYLSDRIGRRPILWLAWFQGMAAAWVMALAPGLGIFVIGSILYYMTMFVAAPLNSYITAGRGDLPLNRALSIVYVSFSIGAIFGPLIGGWIGEQYGYRSIIFYAACVFILSSALVVLIRPQPIEHTAAEQRTFSLFKNRPFLFFLCANTMAVAAMYLAQPLSANFLQNERNLSLAQIGQVNAMAGLGNVIIVFLLGLLETRLGYLIGLGLTLLFSFLIWRGAGMAWYMPAYFLLGGFRATRLLSSAHIRTLIDHTNMGLAYGVAEGASTLALVLAPILAGFLYAMDPTAMYPASMAAIVASLFINILIIYRPTRSDRLVIDKVN
jgi:predicted MFS family arabinose efflux permease